MMSTPSRCRFILSICLLLVHSGIHTYVVATTFVVENTAPGSNGGKRFAHSIGTVRSTHVMSSAASFIQRTFRQTNSHDQRKHVHEVTLFIEAADGVAYTAGDEIHVSARYIGTYKGDVAQEIRGVIYHEMTHVWQWDGKGRTPGGLIEGIADFVRLKAGYAPSHWARPGEGDKWDQGYDVTARFLDYCEGLRSGFVAELNKKMRFEYRESFFEDLLGKSVHELWGAYKDKYGH
ncbi:unnamed protein product [Linum tenue]|uniref:Plant basic secretory protein (BSP) family protein n=1 Tax=Linum tenue TaxID=586396 RepID=A0AAV0MH95_9ROSI|nr:unnamed protein product [Linum tenue]